MPDAFCLRKIFNVCSIFVEKNILHALHFFPLSYLYDDGLGAFYLLPSFAQARAISKWTKLNQPTSQKDAASRWENDRNNLQASKEPVHVINDFTYGYCVIQKEITKFTISQEIYFAKHVFGDVWQSFYV